MAPVIDNLVPIAAAVGVAAAVVVGWLATWGLSTDQVRPRRKHR